MTGSSPLEYLETEVFPGIEGLDYELREIFGREELEQYGVEFGEDLLTEEPWELRSYDAEYEGFNFPLSAELGVFDGELSIGISAEIGISDEGVDRMKDEAIQKLVDQVAEEYDSGRRTLGHGEYILNIEGW